MGKRNRSTGCAVDARAVLEAIYDYHRMPGDLFEQRYPQLHPHAGTALGDVHETFDRRLELLLDQAQLALGRSYDGLGKRYRPTPSEILFPQRRRRAKAAA